MRYVYLVFMYQPAYKYDGYVNYGHYKSLPKVFNTYEGALRFHHNYKHASFIRKVKLYE